MDSTLFVITQLTELIKLFGNIKVRYECELLTPKGMSFFLLLPAIAF